MVNDTPEPVYELRGEIPYQGKWTFYNAIKAQKHRGGWVILDSVGGSASDSVVIGLLVRKYKMKTYVRRKDQCLSGCAMIWAAGVERWNEGGMNLAFHRPYIPLGDKTKDGPQEPFRKYYRDLGYSEEAIEKFLWPANSFYWLNAEKAKKLGIKANFKE